MAGGTRIRTRKLFRSAGSVAVAAVAMTALVACGSDSTGGTASGSATVSKPAGASGASGASGGSAGAGESGASTTSTNGEEGRCIDPASPMVADALASIPSFYDRGFKAYKTLDAVGSCPKLRWVEAHLDGATASSPQRVLFFDENGYVGPATAENTTYTQVVDTGENSVSVQFRWLNPNDISANPTGGPVTVTYSLQDGAIVADRDVPPQVFGDNPGTPASPASTETTVPPETTTKSHCDTASNEALTAAVQMQFGDRIVQPFTVDSIACSGDWAMARVPARPGYEQNSRVLFNYTGGGWSTTDLGSGFSCTERGVPAEDAAAMGCS